MTVHIQVRYNEDRRRVTQEVTLGGVRVRLWAQYNKTTDRWYLDVRDLDDTLIIGGIACVNGVNLLLPYRHLAIPQGALFCFSVDGLPPTFSTLDSTARILYA